MRADLADTIQRAVIQLPRAVRLALQPDTDMFNRAGEDGVGDTSEGASGEVLVVAELGFAALGFVAVFEVATGLVEGAELDGDTGADADEGRESAFVEGEGAFVLVD